jgi:siroheme synthase
MPGQDLHRVAASLLRSGLPGELPCVAVTDASRPEAAYSASRLSGLAALPTTLAPTLLLVGHAFEAVLRKDLGDALCSVENQSTVSRLNVV